MATLKKQMAIIRECQRKAPVPVVRIAKALGLIVYKAPNFQTGLSGIIRRHPDDPQRYAIYVNGSHGINRRRFTIAHETAHYILHRDLIGDGIVDDMMYRSGISNVAEAQANRLAADILMPWHLLDPLIIDSGFDDVDVLANRFSVSRSAMAIRLGVPYETT